MLLNSVLQQKCVKNKWMPADVEIFFVINLKIYSFNFKG